MTLTGPDSQAIPVAEFVLHLVRTGGKPFDLVVIDTMARVMGNLDENMAPDIADLLRNLDVIRSATEAHIALIHHVGKDAARGARDHSSLRASIDTEIEITRDDTGIITAQVMKQRDGPTGGKFHYRLRQVELGFDQDGDAVTTCVVDPVHNEAASKPSISGQVEKALEILSTLITREDNDLYLPSVPRVRCARVDDWASACVPPGAISSAKNNDDRRRIWHRCRDQLVDAGLIQIDGDFVGMAGST